MPSVNSKAKSKSLGRIGAVESQNPAAVRSHDGTARQDPSSARKK